jgi:lysophospholipase L1-like esterase
MNSNRRVLHFVTGSVCIYLILSLVAPLLKMEWKPFQRVNLVSDLVYSKESDSITSGKQPDTAEVKIDAIPDKDFSLYKRPRLITGFSPNTEQASLTAFCQKLAEMKAGKRKKVRIAYFGDSMIEGDLLTQTLRQLLQKAFGGSGVGFVPITSQVSKFRQTVFHNYSGGWKDDNFKNSNNSRLYLSGHIFHSGGDWVEMRDNSIADSSLVIEKSLLYGNAGSIVQVTANGTPINLESTLAVKRKPLFADRNYYLKLTVADERLPVYGVSFESTTGVIVDNFSFRGITGIEYGKISSDFLKAIGEENGYDLIVFQYGVNLLFRPNDRNFSWYAKAMLPVVKKIRTAFPQADFLLVSTADRGFYYGGEVRSAVGIDSLVKVQAAIAWETGSYFYNQFASMGGTNSIVDWARKTPPLANKDYVHPNHRGAEILARYLYEAMLTEYNKTIRARK